MTTPPEEIQATIDRFWETFPFVWNAVRSRVRSAATERQAITVEQFHILRHVRRGCDSVSAIAEAQAISRPAVSQAVEALVQKGLVTRHPGGPDRRTVRLALTEDGAGLLAAIFAEARTWMAGRLEQLPPARLREVQRALQTLRQAFDSEARA